MERRIYIPIFGSGLGHATRMLLVAKRLERDGFKIKFSSSSADSLKFLINNGFICNRVATVDVGWDNEGNFSYKRSIRQFPHALVNFTKQVLSEFDYIKEFNPHLILSDSRLSALLASLFLKIPCITILNQIKILLPLTKNSRIAHLIECIYGELIGELWSLSDLILIPDLPPPYTISEANLWGIKSTLKKTRYIGFIIPQVFVNENEKDLIIKKLSLNENKPIIYAQISGPSKTGIKLVKIMFKVAEILAGDCNFIISSGIPSGAIEPIKIIGGWYYEWCPIKDKLFSLADMVVIRGGHSTIAQGITFGKPMLCIPIYKHSEQMKNAEKVEKLKCGLSINSANLSIKQIVNAIKILIYNNEYKRNVERLRMISLKYNGLDNIVNIIKSYV